MKYTMGRRLTGAFVTVIGMALLMGAVYTSTRLSVPVLNVGLAVCGAGTILAGFAINHIVVRRRISKRGYFYW